MNLSRSFGVLIALGFTVSFVMLVVVATVGYFNIAGIWNNAHKMRANLCSGGRNSQSRRPCQCKLLL
jgi:hypothetical protein